MNCKISFAILLCLFVFTSCQDVIDLDVPDGKVQLVVDGWLTDQQGEKQVLLSTTANYFNNTTTPMVTGAQVLLYSEAGALDTLDEKEPGIYTTEYVGLVGETYHIYIRTAAGEEYLSRPETLRAVPPITAIYSEYREETAFEDGGYYIRIDTDEPAGAGDYYRWKQYVNGEYLNSPYELYYASDIFVDGNPIVGLEINDAPVELGDHYRVQQMSISKSAYEFFEQLYIQTATTGFLFDSPPAALHGNIYQKDDPSKNALGYFGVSAVSEKELVVE